MLHIRGLGNSISLSVFPELIYRFSGGPMEILVSYFVYIDKLMLMFI